jgi:6-phosphogluconolactonase (cycloisomerase 2 family)
MQNTFLFRSLLAATLATAYAAAPGTAQAQSASDNAQSDDAPGAVFVLTNQPTGNAVLAYARAANGSLKLVGSYPTGGKGAGSGGDPLGSQGSLTLGSGFLFAVNAGSNDVSMFAVRGAKLVLVDRRPSGGQMPVSVAVKGFVAYVLNAGGTPNVSGFFVDPVNRHLLALPNSTRALAGGKSAQPAMVGFSADGDELFVSEKGTQLIDSYRIGSLGEASAAIPNASFGVTPFGFAPLADGDALFAEAGSNAVSSYAINDMHKLDTITGSIRLAQLAPCWIVATGDGRYAYTANAGSGTISSLRVSMDGTIRLKDAKAAVVGQPFDLALSKNSKFLYVREGNGTVSGFSVNTDGSLTPAGTVSGIPAGAQGIAAR